MLYTTHHFCSWFCRFYLPTLYITYHFILVDIFVLQFAVLIYFCVHCIPHVILFSFIFLKVACFKCFCMLCHVILQACMLSKCIILAVWGMSDNYLVNVLDIFNSLCFFNCRLLTGVPIYIVSFVRQFMQLSNQFRGNCCCFFIYLFYCRLLWRCKWKKVSHLVDIFVQIAL